jgi:hypothetical protein
VEDGNDGPIDRLQEVENGGAVPLSIDPELVLDDHDVTAVEMT